MLSTLKNAFKVPDLKKRILFTLFLIAVYRLGSHIPVPGINREILQSSLNTSDNVLLGFYDLISGGAIRNFSIFAMGVVPYINASIIIQLLTVAIPYLEQLSKEGEEGRKKIQKYTRNAALVLGIIQAYTTYILISNYGGIADHSTVNVFLIILTLTTSSTFLMWLGDVITVKGLGNGVSLLIFINIISSLPQTAQSIYLLKVAGTIDLVQVIVFILVLLIMIIAVITMSMAERRITVQYAGKTVGNKNFKGQSSHIPFNMTSTAVIAIIFAMSVMSFPKTIAQFWPNAWLSRLIINGTWSPFNEKNFIYPIVYALLVVFFSWFYAEVTFKPEEMAENIYKSSGFIPGIRPGKPTAKFISKILTRVAIIGGIFATIVAITPVLVQNHTKFTNISFGGTSILIMVNVAMETLRTLESQLVMRHYHGFLK
ncbi:preprotein translocase subunit SecY [Clostridium thermarum]|uniref:preprotein translocase subunit SecY n=1 Tax=Clostridium thermarum TaxID=1716543 RepID=UPI00111D8EDD|nr:preprotein translocase subunit SecY [Clostridium thermarum]